MLFDAPLAHVLPGVRRLIEDGITPVACVLSHADVPAVGNAVKQLHEEFELPMLLHPRDQMDQRIADLKIDWQDPMGHEVLAEFPVEVLHWPGHSPGSVMLYIPEFGGVLLAGDSLVRPGPMQPDGDQPLVRPPSDWADDAKVLQHWRDLSLDPLRTLAPLHGEPLIDIDNASASITTMLDAGPMKSAVRRVAPPTVRA
ncbi:MAG: MBL fold metallo-hydrolase [Planctomycetota bacterium]